MVVGVEDRDIRVFVFLYEIVVDVEDSNKIMIFMYFFFLFGFKWYIFFIRFKIIICRILFYEDIFFK